MDDLDCHFDRALRRRAAHRRPRGVPPARRGPRHRPGPPRQARRARAWSPAGDRTSRPRRSAIPVTAFLTLEIRQGAGHDAVGAHLAGIPEVLEACTITGAGDMWCRLVARSNTDLQRVIDRVLGRPGIERSTTVIALADADRPPGAAAGAVAVAADHAAGQGVRHDLRRTVPQLGLG